MVNLSQSITKPKYEMIEREQSLHHKTDHSSDQPVRTSSSSKTSSEARHKPKPKPTPALAPASRAQSPSTSKSFRTLLIEHVNNNSQEIFSADPTKQTRTEAKTEVSHISTSAGMQASSSPSYILKPEDFNRCRAILRSNLFRYTRSEFVILNVLMSAVLNGFRSLNKYELYGLLTLSLSQTSTLNKDVIALAETLIEPPPDRKFAWQNSGWTSLLLMHQNGFLDFSDQSMRHFLSMYTIPGLDVSHMAIANACVRQLEVENGVSHPLFKLYSSMSENACNTSAFSSYAKQFWSFHYRLVQPPCPLLSERVHQLIYEWSCQSLEFHDECTWQAPCRDIANAALRYCIANHLQQLAAAYIRVSTGAAPESFDADQAGPEVDLHEAHLTAAISQLEITQIDKCSKKQQGGSSSPESIAIPENESWIEDHRRVLI